MIRKHMPFYKLPTKVLLKSIVCFFHGGHKWRKLPVNGDIFWGGLQKARVYRSYICKRCRMVEWEFIWPA